MSPVPPSPEAQRSASAVSASQAVAAIVLAGATALLPASSLPAASGYQPVLNDPFASATTHTIPMPYDASGSATDVINFIVPRWRRYVEQRLRELSLGAHNFTGLRVPSGHVVDLAARVAQDWFYPDTPTRRFSHPRTARCCLCGIKLAGTWKLSLDQEERRFGPTIAALGKNCPAPWKS